MKSKIGA